MICAIEHTNLLTKSDPSSFKKKKVLLQQGGWSIKNELECMRHMKTPSYTEYIWFFLNIISLYFPTSLQSIQSPLLMQYLVSGKLHGSMP